MPLFYKKMGIMKEHIHCRTKAGLFDVSHMCPVRIHGKDRVKFAEKILPGIAQFEVPPTPSVSTLFRRLCNCHSVFENKETQRDILVFSGRELTSRRTGLSVVASE